MKVHVNLVFFFIQLQMLPECVFCKPPKMWKFGIRAKSYLYMYVEYLLNKNIFCENSREGRNFQYAIQHIIAKQTYSVKNT